MRHKHFRHMSRSKLKLTTDFYLILCSGADSEFVCDKFDDFWLIEEDGLVKRRGAVLWVKQEPTFRKLKPHDHITFTHNFSTLWLILKCYSYFVVLV